VRLLREDGIHEVVGIVRDEAATDTFYGSDEGGVGEGLSVCEGLEVYDLGGGGMRDEDLKLWLSLREADVWILGGCRYILGEELLEIPSFGVVGVHGGKLPEYRGSSPLNWALIRGCYAYWLTVMEVVGRVDGGKVLESRRYGIGLNDTIRDLHTNAEQEYPLMVRSVLERLESGVLGLRGDEVVEGGNYLPIRFPDDGEVVWDRMGSGEIHNLVRGLGEPYPCARVRFGGRSWRILESRLMEGGFEGRSGRVYRKDGDWLQVGTQRGGVWLRGEAGLSEMVSRYDIFDA
jgi:methionyl-tRNA formyltransferase